MVSKKSFTGTSHEGSPTSTAIDPVMLDQIISSIYDCAIAPERWEQTLKMICEGANWHSAGIGLLDPESGLTLFIHCFGISSEWIERHYALRAQFVAEIMHSLQNYSAGLEINEPMVISRHWPTEFLMKANYYRLWMKPQGIIDHMAVDLPSEQNIQTYAAFGQDERRGQFGESDIALASLLRPHLQRAVTISNLMNLQALEIDNLRTVIANLSVAILLVAEDGSILKTNPAAEALLEYGQMICEAGGRVSAKLPGQAQALRQAIDFAARDELVTGDGAIALGDTQSGFAVAHILPLNAGKIRSTLHHRAIAAILVSPGANQYAKLPKAKILGFVFGLTAGEQRVAEALADGKSSLDAAQLLGISERTIRGHLTRIYAKTGVTRQAELISLMHGLNCPLYVADRPQNT